MSQFLAVLSTVLTYFTPAVAVLAIAMGLINLFLAGRRSWIVAILRVVFTAVAAVGALPLTRLLEDLVGHELIPWLLSFLPAEVNDILTTVAVGEEGLLVLASLILAPILYLLIFIALRLLLAVIGWILCKCIPALGEPSVRGVSMPLGAVNGVLIVLVLLMPLCGFLAMAGRVTDTFVDCIEENNSAETRELLATLGTDEEDLSEVADHLINHTVIGTMDMAIAGPVFDILTVGTLDTTATHGAVIEMDLEHEISSFFCTVVHVLDAKGALEKETFTTSDKQALYTAADSILESEWVSMLATDTLVAVSTAWLEDDTVLGLKAPEVPANVKPLYDRTLLILSTETIDTLGDDIHTIMDVVGDFLVADLLSGEIGSDQMIRNISDSGILTNTLTKLKANPRLAPLATELKALSIRLVTDMLGVESLRNGEYAEMMGSVADELNGVLDMSEDERHEAIGGKLEQVFVDYGYDVPEDVAMEVSDQLIEELGKDGEITGDELTDYLINHSDELGELIPDDVEPDDLPLDEIPNDSEAQS